MATPLSPAAVAGRALRLAIRSREPARLVTLLHNLAIEGLGARSSVVLQPEPGGTELRVVSAVGLDNLPLDAWLTTTEGAGAAGRAVAADGPVTINALAATVPELAERLGASSAVIAPLVARDAPIGLLVLGFADAIEVEGAAVAALADGFTLAFERGRQQREADLERDLRDLLLTFSRGGESAFAVAESLAVFCRNVAWLLGADVAELWQHDRRARELVLAASSDGAEPGRRVPTADQESAAADGLRQAEPLLLRGPVTDGATDLSLVVPLRGRRRALGTLVLQGLRLESGAERDLLARAGQVGRGLSLALENLQLLDDVLGSRSQMENVFNSLTDPVVVTGLAGRIVAVNEAFAARLGKSRTVLVDSDVRSLVGPALSESLDTLLTSSDLPLTSQEVSDEILGGRFVVLHAPLVALGARPAGSVLVLRDVTRARQLEEERTALERRLAESEKLLALGQFVAGIAHELNNPLQGVMGHLELVRASADLPRAIRRDLAVAWRDAVRASRIVRNLLVFAGSGRLNMRLVNLNAVVTRVLRLRAPSLKVTGVEVVRQLDADLPLVRADGLLLQQAILNVVINAEQAMAGAGRITVRSFPRARPGACDSKSMTPARACPPDVRRRLFEPFFTTKDVGKGTGLGLAIAFGIVQAHQGTLEVDNHAGGGARFALNLPIATERARTASSH